MKPKLEKLEMLRGFAALYVFAGHFLGTRVWDREGGLTVVFRFGQEAVMLFFLISGFVIFYAAERAGDWSFRRYFVRRFRRIYPIYLLALAISLGLAYLASGSNPEDFSAERILGNIFMLQDFSDGKPGVWVSTLAGNRPLWSLSYEWWFYLAFFPLWRFVPAGGRIHVAGVVSLVGFATYWLLPNQASLFAMYFIVWWSGAELARTYLGGRRPRFATEWRSLLYLGAMVGLSATPVALAWSSGSMPRPGLHPMLEFRHLAAGWLILGGALVWARLKWVGFVALFGVFARVAPISYALYVLHLPLAVNSTYLAGVGPNWVQWVGYVAIAVGVAYVAEGPVQRWINRRTERWVRVG